MMKKMAMCVDDKVEAELELARQDAGIAEQIQTLLDEAIART